MIQSNYRACFIFVMLTLAGSSSAQSSEANLPTESELENARALIQAGRKEVIREELRLSEEEAAAFWPLYEEYRRDVLVIQDRHAALITDYVNRYHEANLTDRYADNLIDNYFDIKGDLLRTQERYVRQFRRILPPLKVALFYQLENKLNAAIESQLALVIPLVDPN